MAGTQHALQERHSANFAVQARLHAGLRLPRPIVCTVRGKSLEFAKSYDSVSSPTCVGTILYSNHNSWHAILESRSRPGHRFNAFQSNEYWNTKPSLISISLAMDTSYGGYGTVSLRCRPWTDHSGTLILHTRHRKIKQTKALLVDGH